MIGLWLALMVGVSLSLVGHMLRSAVLVLIGTLVLIGGMLWPLTF